MKRRFKTFFLSAAGGTLIGFGVAHAQIPGGALPVFDASAFLTLGKQLIQDIQVVSNTLHTFEELVATYKMWKQEFTYFANKSKWKALGTLLWNDAAQNIKGETALWNPAIDGDDTLAPGAWANATLDLYPDYAWYQGGPGSDPNVADLASAEIADTTGINSIRSLADIRDAELANRQSLDALEATALDGSDSTNMQVQQLNIASVAAIASLRNQQAMFSLAAYQTEQALASNLILRNGVVNNLNRFAKMYEIERQEPVDYTESSSEINGYRTP